MEKHKKLATVSTLNRKFQLLVGSYSISDIQDYFNYIIKKHEIVMDNLSVRIYVNKIDNNVTFKIKVGFYLELSISKTMKFLGITKIGKMFLI